MLCTVHCPRCCRLHVLVCGLLCSPGFVNLPGLNSQPLSALADGQLAIEPQVLSTALLEIRDQTLDNRDRQESCSWICTLPAIAAEPAIKKSWQPQAAIGIGIGTKCAELTSTAAVASAYN